MTDLYFNSPRVYVVLPVYNGESFVLNAIQSIQNQTFQNWEMIILNDGSTDRTLEICKESARQDPRIHVYSNERNLGLAKTMNRLIQLACNEFVPYIAIQEADDYSLPSRLELEIKILDSKPEIGVVSGIAEWVEELGSKPLAYFPGILTSGKQYPQNKSEMVAFLYVEQSKVVNAACMFRRSLIDQTETPFDADAKMSIDWQFFVHMAHKCNFYGLPSVLVQARRGSSRDSLTSKKNIQFFEARRCIRLLYEEYRNNQESPINYWLYRKAMSTELVLEGRNFFEKGSYERIKGVLIVLKGLIYNPINLKGWKSLWDFFLRALYKLTQAS